jgi:hypothetical protein
VLLPKYACTAEGEAKPRAAALSSAGLMGQLCPTWTEFRESSRDISRKGTDSQGEGLPCSEIRAVDKAADSGCFLLVPAHGFHEQQGGIARLLSSISYLNFNLSLILYLLAIKSYVTLLLSLKLCVLHFFVAKFVSLLELFMCGTQECILGKESMTENAGCYFLKYMLYFLEQFHVHSKIQ